MATNNGSIFNKLRMQGSDSIRRFRGQVAAKGSAVIFVILALISIAVLIAFLVMKLKAATSKGVLIVGDPLQLYNMTTQISISQSNIPPTTNGQEFSFSMWLYLIDFAQTAEGPQLVFMRGADGTTVNLANPIVAFDGRTNKLYVSVKTNATPLTGATATTFYDMTKKTGYLTSSIDYFPLQRWVNVVGAVQDDSLSVYMNSYLYSVSNVVDLMTADTTILARPVFSACTGNLYVGATGVSGVREPRAFITQFNFYNYAVTTKEIGSLYKAGPSSSSFFAKLGLAGYGLRSPVYRIGA